MITLQSPSKDGARLTNYLLNGGGHDGSEERNLYVETMNLMPSASAAGYIRQFKREWSRASPRHMVQMRHMIFSPSSNEIPYDKENAQAFAGMVKEYLQEHYPNRRALICIQNDGKGYTDEDGNFKKILHCHVALSDCDIYTYKGVDTERTGFKYLSKTFDEFITEKHGIKIDKGLNSPKRKYLNKQLRVEGEKDATGRFFSFIDDIKDRINRCAQKSNTMSDFFDNLYQFGLSVKHKKKKSGEEYETYYLEDTSNTTESQIKNLTKKGKQLAMRSYKHDGYSIDVICKRLGTIPPFEKVNEPDANKLKDAINGGQSLKDK